ncbi:putative ATP-dependent RNA helicase TDRD12 isoform X2 [Oryctolagus cuniculus]|uniref:putative ATP-dependent RNA helicase TDRD12 isoform X2 n=1 Tax=Oryctolagus cuniculus TaxID=9986 RepID=UPI00387A2BA3
MAGAARLATPATPAAGRVVQGERARGAAKMLQVLVLQVEDPDCFWVIIKGCSPFLDHEVDYQKLNSAMNDFYNSMCKDIEIKPLMLEEGQVCVVYCLELRCWCRAVIKSIMSSADHYLAECFLVDFARYIPVKSKNIRVAVESFMQLPYRAKKFRLYCMKPVTLHIDFCEDSAEIVLDMNALRSRRAQERAALIRQYEQGCRGAALLVPEEEDDEGGCLVPDRLGFLQ